MSGLYHVGRSNKCLPQIVKEQIVEISGRIQIGLYLLLYRLTIQPNAFPIQYQRATLFFTLLKDATIFTLL